jgi:hypothetical protein
LDSANSVTICAVFLASPPVANLGVSELALEHTERVLDLGPDAAVADDHGEPAALLAALNAAEAETAALRGQLKAILAEALAR